MALIILNLDPGKMEAVFTLASPIVGDIAALLTLYS